MAGYSFKSVDLMDAQGSLPLTGLLNLDKPFVHPASVQGNGPLWIGQATRKVHCLLYELSERVVPNWFGVAIPEGVTDLSEVILYFHPIPGQANYHDRDYAAKAGKWRANLPNYMWRMGMQIALSGKPRALIMPFFTSASSGTLGMFAANWKAIVNSLLSLAHARVAPADDIVPVFYNLTLASFSAGIEYLDAFLRLAPDYRQHLREIYDFDGSFSAESSHLSRGLPGRGGGARVVIYDQVDLGKSAATMPNRFHLPLGRWAGLQSEVKTPDDVHQAINRHMLYHALATSFRD